MPVQVANMRIKFYKFRALLAIYIIRFIAFVLGVETPPILSVSAIIKKDRKLLFVDLSYLNGYGLPGGHVRANESLEEALTREVFEETGFKIKRAEYFSSYTAKYKGISTISASFLTEVIGSPRPSNEGHLVWLEPEKAIGKMAYEDNEKTIKDLLKK